MSYASIIFILHRTSYASVTFTLYRTSCYYHIHTIQNIICCYHSHYTEHHMFHHSHETEHHMLVLCSHYTEPHMLPSFTLYRTSYVSILKAMQNIICFHYSHYTHASIILHYAEHHMFLSFHTMQNIICSYHFTLCRTSYVPIISHYAEHLSYVSKYFENSCQE